MDDVDLRDSGGHGDIGSEDPEGGVGAFGEGFGMGGGSGTGFAHALDVDQFTERTQMSD
jgi:hypothetical protein